MAGVNTRDVTKGAGQLIDPAGVGGIAGGVLLAPMARGAIYQAAPGVFTDGDNAVMAGNAFLLGQGVVGGMMAAGRLGRGGMTRAVGAGVAVEAVRGLIERVLPSS